MRRAETLLEREREQALLWVPVALGTGITAWFMLPSVRDWMAFLCLCLSVAILCLGVGRGRGRLLRMAGIGALLMAAGCVLVWGKAVLVGGQPLARPAVVTMTARVVHVQMLPAREIVRLTVRPLARADLPRRVRLNLSLTALPASPLRPGMDIRLRARLMPPAAPALPGGYDFSRRAWFDGLGATGKVLGMPTVVVAGTDAGPSLQQRLSAHVAAAVPGGPGAVAAALASGDRGHIAPEDEEAMRRSGLAHLLSISGLHVTAVVGAVVLLTIRLLALWPTLALRWPLMLVGAISGASAGVGYTLLTGAEVPTIRSCIAALLVMAAMALGRRAFTLRLVAAGATLILLFWPEALTGPSFQLSFAAVVAIVALAEMRPVRAFFAPREEHWWQRGGRLAFGLFITGLAVEAALAPIALYHFHLTGMLGALANMIAIPLTEFVIMPAIALALLLDVAGMGAPLWWIADKALAAMLALAHAVAAQDSAILLTPAIPATAFGAVMAGFLWLCLWQSRLRLAAVPMIVAGLLGYATARTPDMLVTGDGRHVAVRTAAGGLALLREGAGDYVRDQFAELAGWEGEAEALARLPGARCSDDFCAVTIGAQQTPGTRVLLARSRLMVPWNQLVAACAAADIVVADRTLPDACRPRWLKLDRRELRRAGGASIILATGTVHRSRNPADEHPWVVIARVQR